MNHIIKLSLLLGMFMGCAPNQKEVVDAQMPTKIKMVTTKGDIVLSLYDETPLHRDNFIKSVKEGVFDGLLFHRVIENFMIQSGNTENKYDSITNRKFSYTLPSEIKPEYFHKKGALAAARTGNPERESSSTGFYIVKGKVMNDSLLEVNEKRINTWLSEYHVMHDPMYKGLLDSLKLAMETENVEAYLKIHNKFTELAKDYTGFDVYSIPDAHREVYKTIGGTPHLDQNYTVFGEVLSGLKVVDSIAAVATDSLDRPLVDVRVLRVEIIEQ